MATTSLSLGEHWEIFIKNEIASGRYGWQVKSFMLSRLEIMDINSKSKLFIGRIYNT